MDTSSLGSENEDEHGGQIAVSRWRFYSKLIPKKDMLGACEVSTL